MSGLESQLWVNTLFRDRQLAEFLAVKNHLGIQSNAEVIRHLIHKQARVLRRRPRPHPYPGDQAPAPLASQGQEGTETADRPAAQPSGSPDVQSLCLSCPLPDCDETDPGCRYQQATGQRQVKCERMRAYSRRTRSVRRTRAVRPQPDEEA